jgi:hypothetical protein
MDFELLDGLDVCDRIRIIGIRAAIRDATTFEPIHTCSIFHLLNVLDWCVRDPC